MCRKLLPYRDKTIRRIEFIGNSITCGMGADTSGIPCGKAEWYDQHNAYFSYGPVTARRFNARWHLSSNSGIGLIHSCCDKGYEMPDVYETMSLEPGGKPWDFSRYAPDLVTICLGQNDGIQDLDRMAEAYIDFIETLRGYYPSAEIICLSSPMADSELKSFQADYLTAVVNRMHQKGDLRIRKYIFEKSYNSGCDAHPDLAEHLAIADELTAFVKQNFGWKYEMPEK